MGAKLHLNQELIDRARVSAAKAADDVQGFIDVHTTVARTCSISFIRN